MNGGEIHIPAMSGHLPWNKGKLIGPKPPFQPKHVWSIRNKLQLEGRTRDLAMFKHRGGDDDRAQLIIRVLHLVRL